MQMVNLSIILQSFLKHVLSNAVYKCVSCKINVTVQQQADNVCYNLDQT